MLLKFFLGGSAGVIVEVLGRLPGKKEGLGPQRVLSVSPFLSGKAGGGHFEIGISFKRQNFLLLIGQARSFVFAWDLQNSADWPIGSRLLVLKEKKKTDSDFCLRAESQFSLFRAVCCS